MPTSSPLIRTALLTALLAAATTGCFLDGGSPDDGGGMDPHTGAIAAAGRIPASTPTCNDTTTWVFTPLSLDPDQTEGTTGAITDHHDDTVMRDPQGFCYSRSFAPRLRLGTWRVTWQRPIGVKSCDVDIHTYNHLLITENLACSLTSGPGF
jgi:hypothetical protein